MIDSRMAYPGCDLRGWDVVRRVVSGLRAATRWTRLCWAGAPAQFHTQRGGDSAGSGGAAADLAPQPVRSGVDLYVVALIVDLTQDTDGELTDVYPVHRGVLSERS